MADIFGKVVALETQGAAPTADGVGAVTGLGVTLEIRRDTVARYELAPGASALAGAFAAALEILRNKNCYVCLRTNSAPESELFSDVLTAIWGEVESIFDRADGNVGVTLFNVASPLVLMRSHPHFSESLRLLRSSLHGTMSATGEGGEFVAIAVACPPGEIQAVQAVAGYSFTDCSRADDPSDEQLVLSTLGVADIESLKEFVTRERARPQFPMASSLGTLAVAPYQYVWSYCWLRAHLIAEALVADGIDAVKLWVTPSDPGELLQTRTAYLPSCFTGWTFHVVPVVKVPDGELRVIDPSFYSAPEPLDRFARDMGTAIDTLVTARSVYEFSGLVGSTPLGPCPSLVDAHLAEARAALLLLQACSKQWPPCS